MCSQRGVCPGLNALANHGYLPRNGIVTAQQVIQATSEVFNMGEDLSALLCFIAVTYGGNLETQTFSSGSPFLSELATVTSLLTLRTPGVPL